jgi:tetratricopeptide (TPR) repeat protein
MNYRVVYFLSALALPAIAAAQGPALTPAEIGIQKAQAQMAKQPRYVPAFSSLAMAYARRARETSDVQFYQKAEDTLQEALKIEPGNFEALRVRAWLLLGRHEFAKALEAAKGLNKRSPDDVTVYGYLVDANAELGNYHDAVDAAQWMLNLRPGNVAGLTRAAYLRELHGDISGALDLMQSAYDSTPYQESEDRAWLLTQMAHLHFVDGNLPEAEKYATGALGVFPDYHYALGTLAQVRTAQHRYEEAVTLLARRYSKAPHAENLYSLAEALAQAGRADEAARDFAEFERKSLAESQIGDNSNHELMAYYNDFAHQPEKALKIAEQELNRRHDVFTLDAYAWSLAGMGDYAAAEIQMKKALATGIRDPKILDHARIISEDLSRSASLKN